MGKTLFRDVKACFRGASKSLVDNPINTTKTFVFPSPISLSVTVADAGLSCGKNVLKRRKIVKKGCDFLKEGRLGEAKNAGQIYQYEGFGSPKSLFDECERR